MAKLLRLRRGTDTQHSSFTGAEGEVTVNTTNDSLHVHDGTTAGGRELMRADKNNMPNSGVAAGTYGSSSAIPAITVDAKGLVTSATTSAIDSTAITNGTSNVSVAASGDITATRAGTQRMAVTSTGIDVTGSVACDGLTVDGTALVQSTVGQIELKDTNNTSPDSECLIRGKDSGNSNLWYYGTGSGNEDVYVWNYRPGAMQFATNNTLRAQFTSAGHFVPGADATYDLGSVGAEWNNGYFDGTVHCDGIACEGTATIEASTGVLNLKDNDSTGASNVNYVKGTNNADATYWEVGYVTVNNEHLYVNNKRDGAIIFQTNGTDRGYFSNQGHFIPYANNQYDLGSNSNRWRNVYTNDLNLSNEGGSNDVDGTWGSWTIQEGEDDLFLLNRRNGKKYKFNLSEVN